MSRRESVTIPVTITVLALCAATVGLSVRAVAQVETPEDEITRLRAQLAAAESETEVYRDAIRDIFSYLGSLERRGKERPSARDVLDRIARSHKRASRRPSLGRASMQGTLAWLYYRMEAFEEAETFVVAAIQAFEATVGSNDERTLTAMRQHAEILAALGESERMVEMRRELHRRSTASRGADHGETLNNLTFLAEFLLAEERYDEAETVLATLVEHTSREKQRALHMGKHAAALRGLGRLDEAETLLRETIAIDLRLHGPDDYRTFTDQSRLAWVLDLQGRGAEADELARELRERGVFYERIQRPMISAEYGAFLASRKDYEDAERYLLRHFESGKSRERGANLDRYVRPLIALYEAWGREDKAAEYRAYLSR